MSKADEWLGLLDIALLAIQRKKDIALLYCDNERAMGPLATRSLADLIESLTGGAVKFPCVGSCDLKSEDTWILAVCRADFQRGNLQSMNHFMPVYPRAQVKEDWEQFTEKLRKRCERRLRAAQSSRDEESDEELHPSLDLSIRTLRCKKQFFEGILAMDLMPAEVPGDGSCALWSILALEGGCFAQAMMSNKEHVQKLRKDSSFCSGAYITGFHPCILWYHVGRCCSVVPFPLRTKGY